MHYLETINLLRNKININFKVNTFAPLSKKKKNVLIVILSIVYKFSKIMSKHFGMKMVLLYGMDKKQKVFQRQRF